jgi:crotonobetainyl-CoA:carnitine CoA-transferase CaiB-like acyl-CoA transferase
LSRKVNREVLALQNIKVLDLSGLVPGAFCTMILGDLGAQVVKVEPPTPSELSGSGPSPAGEEKRREAAFFAPNRNKKSIALNLKAQAGKEIFYRLAREADVVVEGYRPGVVRRLGIDYETINKLNPRVVYCSLSGYGQDGPYCGLPGHDVNYISLAGALGLIGPREGLPVIPLNLVADFAGASLYAVIGILSALIARGQTGRGQYVDIAYVDGALSLMTFFTTDYFLNNTVPKRGETALQGAYPYYGVYETKDGGLITIGCLEAHFWENLCRLLGIEDCIPYHFVPEHLVDKPEGKKWDEIRSCLRETFLTKTRDEWFELLSQKDIPVGKVYTLDEVFSDQQVLHRQMVLEVEHPALGKVRQVGIAPKLWDTPGQVRNLSPLLGEHTEEILLELGYSQKEIDSLRQEGVIG